MYSMRMCYYYFYFLNIVTVLTDGASHDNVFILLQLFTTPLVYPPLSGVLVVGFSFGYVLLKVFSELYA